MRQRVLCSAFLRAIKDPFPPARQAGIIGMGVSQNLFTMADIAQKLMPPLCMITMDPEKPVRDQVKMYKFMILYLDILQIFKNDIYSVHTFTIHQSLYSYEFIGHS